MSTISEAILAFDGPTPRVVADLRSVSFDVEHVREDLEDVYSDRDLDEAYQLVMSNQITGDDFRELIGESRYDAQTLFSTTCWCFSSPPTDTTPSSRRSTTTARFR
ncbi:MULTISPECIES: hypothetical protein [Halorubrum]|uniref:Uncharacterized protein n=1 Tax=Halorubrum hochstenium ATCC 700873 TaxID=1227481 RepID=M0FNP2_9EURY|nr:MULTISPECIES: hypothetical protein [Halorubrum]ELZ61560.1 hypothetical protein C467_00966 [Halorubrum hochstenium ATCC 700873]